MINRRTLSAMAMAALAAPLLRNSAGAQGLGLPAPSTPQAGRDAVPGVDRLDRIVLVANDLDRLARFYAQLGFAVDEARPAPDHAALAQARAARARVMRVGAQVVELVAFDPPGAGFPKLVLSTDPWFQHISLIASDMDAMMAQLHTAGGWTPISRNGAVRLSPELVQGLGGGAVSVFKFRDPGGHPLEFVAFSPGSAPPQWSGTEPGLLGYDHSAVGVTDTQRSIGFYCSELGMTLGVRTLNQAWRSRRWTT